MPHRVRSVNRGLSSVSLAFLYYYTYRLPRGVETLIASLANALVQVGVDVSIITARRTIEPLVPPDPRVRIFAYPTSRYFEHALIAPFYAAHFLRHHYDVVVVFYADFGEGLAWRLLKAVSVDLPLVVYLCSPYSAVPHRYQSMARLGWGTQAVRLLADADWVAREAQTFFGRPVGVVPIGTDPHRFCPSPALRAEARRRLGYADTDIVLLNVSALEEGKGTGRVIEALGRLHERFPALHYLVLGQGDYGRVLQDMVASLKLSERVTFGGVTPHLEAYYNLADIFVMLPDQEANSIACHEAMSCGLPVVAANRGGFVETVSPEAGILVDPRCPAEVDAALARLVARPDLRQAMGRAGRVNILAHHSWERVAQQFLEALA